MSDLYSQLKAAWHIDRIEALRAGRAPAPVHVQLILSDLCNQDCGFCAYRMSSGLSNELFAKDGARNPNRRIPTGKAFEIIEDCAAMGVQAIQFTGGGEPTVHPDHLEIFGAAQALGIKTALVTNGVRLDAAHAAVREMTWVRVSIDAGSPQTYARIRRVSEQHWAKAWGTVASLARHASTTVGVGFVMTPGNFREAADAARLARERGAANIRIGAVFSAEGRGFYGDLIPQIRESIAEAEALSDERFRVINLFDRRLADLDAGSPDESLCGYQHLTTYIGGDLGVYRCCNTAYTRAGKVADLTNARFRDLFGGQPAGFDARQCRFCQFRGQNTALAALLRKPDHAEFV